MDPKNINQEPFGLDDEQPIADSGAAPTENDRLLAGLSYATQILIPAAFPVIVLATEETKGRPFLRYHAIQSLGVMVATILWYLAAVVVQALIGLILPFLLCISWMLFLVPAGVLAYYAYRAFIGKQDEIPYLTAFMRQNGWL